MDWGQGGREGGDKREGKADGLGTIHSGKLEDKANAILMLFTP